MDKLTKPSKTALFDAAKRWDIKAVKAILVAAPALVEASDPRGRRALHLACAVKPGNGMLGETNGLKTVAALLKAGAGLEVEVPMDEDEGDFRRNTSLVCGCAGRKFTLGSVSFEAWRRRKLFTLGSRVA